MALTLHTRAELEEHGVLRPPNLAHLEVNRLGDRSGITWHWTGATGVLFRPNPLARLAEIQREHMDGRGYGDIAYNGAFDIDGNVFALRDPHWVGAHARSDQNVANLTTLGFVFLEDSRGLTAAGAGAMQLISYLFELRYQHAPAYWGHREWAAHGGTPTECPGDQLEAFQAFISSLHPKAA